MTDLTLYLIDHEGYPSGQTLTLDAMSPQPSGALLADPPPTPPSGSFVRWTGDAWGFTTTPPPGQRPPPVIVPSRISKLQAELFLYGTGQLAAVKAKIAQKLAAGDEGYDIYWRSSSHFERSHLALAAIAYEMSWSPAQLDSMFIEAAKLV